MYYLYNQAGADHGPFSLDSLRAQVISGEISHDKLARTEDSKEWKVVSHFLPDLAGVVSPSRPSTSSASEDTAGAGPGILAAMGLRACAWLYFAASLFASIRIFTSPERQNPFGELSAYTGAGVLLQGFAALFFFLSVAAISDNVRANRSNNRNANTNPK